MALAACAPEPEPPPFPRHVSYICAPMLFFAEGSATVNDQSKATLDELLDGKGCPAWSGKLLEPNVSFIVRGHADDAGSPGANEALSLRRAEATRDFLVSRGIARERVEVVAYGNSVVRSHLQGHNRRVDVSLARDGKELHFF